MPRHKRPPRGYRQEEYPMVHQFEYHFGLSLENTAKAGTICPILAATESGLAPEDMIVNPSHTLFSEDTGTEIFMGSIVPRISVNIHAFLTNTHQNLYENQIILKWYPLYTAFLESLDAEDIKTASQVEDILELAHGTGSKAVKPQYNGTDLYETAASGRGSFPLTTKMRTQAFADVGLTTDAKLEGVNLDTGLLYDALSYYSNGGMVSKVKGKTNTVRLEKNRGSYNYYSNNFTNPMVKRGNSYTFCGIQFYLPQADDASQSALSSEMTDINHVQIAMRVRYDEWHSSFDQTPY